MGGAGGGRPVPCRYPYPSPDQLWDQRGRRARHAGISLLVFTRNYARMASPRGPLPATQVTREKGANNKYINKFF